MSLLSTLKSPFAKAKSLVTGPGEQPEADPMNPEAHAAFNQAQAGLNKDASQIENEAMATVSPDMPSVSPALQSAAQPMAFGGPETSQALENMAQNRYKDAIQKLRVKTRDESRRMETQNRSKAFENLIEKNKLAQQAHSRRMERKQARYAAKMAVVSTVMQAAGMGIGGAMGASAAGAVGPKPNAAPSPMAGQPTQNNGGIA